MRSEFALRIETIDFTGPARWRWRLVDSAERVLAEHDVRLDTGSPWYEALGDLHAFLRSHAVPDRQRPADEARIVRTFGRWVGTEIFGPIGTVLAACPAGTVVEVVLPTEAGVIASFPLECALVHDGTSGEETLARRGIGLVLCVGDDPPDPAPDADPDWLRILGLFSAPDGTSALNLRRERRSLRTLVDRAGHDRAIDLHILQYGVTRQRLRETVAEGWDIVHVSGHGSPGALLLEQPDGGPDEVTADQLVELLAPSAGRLRLVVVSTCSSAALSGGPTASTLAVTLAERLDCVVLAMRFPVAEHFAAALTTALYERLITTPGTLPEALHAVLAPLVPTAPTRGFPALSVVTPAVFGRRARHTTVRAPRATNPDGPEPPLHRPAPGELPPPRTRFAGRVEVLARAGAALAPDSGLSTVVLQGMAGVGTTACALELAHTHRDSFRSVVWFSLPRDRSADGPAPAEFTAALGGTDPTLDRVLVVIDGADELLTADGRWAAGWDATLATLTAHGGPGRLVITTRRPVPVPRGHGLVHTVPTLAADEAWLLAQELPGLAALLDSHPALVRRALDHAHGHPGLLELIDGQAAEPDRLATWLERLPGAEGDYAAALDGWATASVCVLTAEERTFVFLLCALEEVDRDYMLGALLMMAWPAIHGFAGLAGGPTDPGRILDVLAAHALVAVDLAEPHPKLPTGLVRGARMQPRVRSAIRRQAPDGFQHAVDSVIARIFLRFREDSMRRGELSPLIAVAGRSALPYLVRLEEWGAVEGLLLEVTVRDTAAATAGALVPVGQHLVDATEGTEAHLRARRILARLRYGHDPARGLADGQVLLDDATAAGRDDVVRMVASDLVNAYRAAGRLSDAARMVELTGREDDHPWARLGQERERLRILDLSGKHGEALIGADRCLREAEDLPEDGPAAQGAMPWHIREGLLNTAGSAASHLRQWDLAIDYWERLAALQRARNAYPRDLAITRFNSVGPLRGLGRTDEALVVLRECRAVFEAQRDSKILGLLLSELSDIEDQRGEYASALDTRLGVLRIAYHGGDPLGIAGAHRGYAGALQRDPERATEMAAHHLADAVIRVLIGNGELWGPILALAREPDGTRRPGSVDELVSITDRLDGVRLDDLLRRLAPDPDERANALGAFTRQAATRRRPLDGPRDDGPEVIPLPGYVPAPEDVQIDRAARALPSLSPDALLFFRFLCALESEDLWGRFFTQTLAANWPDVWRRVGPGGPPPAIRELLTAIDRPELAIPVLRGDGETGAVAIQSPVAGLVHDAGFQRVVDEELAAYWPAVPEALRRRGGGPDTGIDLLAARSALPYQMRLGRWGPARQGMQYIIVLDQSPEVAEKLLPTARELVAATAGTKDELPARHNLARIARVMDAAGGLVLSRRVLADAVAAGNWRLASVVAEDVLVACEGAGQLTDALDVAASMAEYSRRAGYGPWTQLHDERSRVSLLLRTGRAAEAHTEVTRLLARAGSLPGADDDAEAVQPTQVREQLLDTAARTAAAVGAWPDALRHLEDEVTSMRDRNAPVDLVAEVRFRQWGPLRALGRLEDARDLVLECRKVFVVRNDLRLGLAAQEALAQLGHDG